MKIDEIEELCTVDIITPDGETIQLAYSKEMSNVEYTYTYTTLQSGNYIFKATNSKGRSSEITVPMDIEDKIKTFSIKISETETREFKFYEGQTWKEFIGNNVEEDMLYPSIKINGTVFIDRRIVFASTGEVLCWLCKTENYYDRISSTDVIIEGGIYYLVPYVC